MAPESLESPLFDVAYYTAAAEQHAAEAGLTLGMEDMAAYMRAMWSLMTPAQRHRFAYLPTVRQALAGALSMPEELPGGVEPEPVDFEELPGYTLIRLSEAKPAFGKGLRAVVYTQGKAFEGIQFFRLDADELYMNSEAQGEIVQAATHWARPNAKGKR